MTPIAPHLTAFLRERLPHEMGASPHTTDSYARTLKLLLVFASQRTGASPSKLTVEQIDAPLILAFLEHLERDRGNSGSTRNARLAAIKTFVRYIEFRVPSALDQARRILAIPFKKTDISLVPYLTREEMQAILAVPEANTRDGIRDRAMLHLGFATGMRVSELVGLRLEDVTLQPTPSVRIRGKGRRERALPLWKDTVSALRAWLAIRGEARVPELFLSARGHHLTRAGFEYILRRHVGLARKRCASLESKRVSPHVLRHTCAMNVLQATRDVRLVSLWLGHASVQSTEVYLRADPSEKLEVLGSVVIPKLHRGTFRPPDKLLETIQGSMLCGAAAARSSPETRPERSSSA